MASSSSRAGNGGVFCDGLSGGSVQAEHGGRVMISSTPIARMTCARCKTNQGMGNGTKNGKSSQGRLVYGLLT